MVPVIRVHNLRKTFNSGHSYVLDGIDISINRGSITAIIGFSGTGKSVLLRHILSLATPTSGDIEVFGRSLSAMSNQERIHTLCQFGVLFQNAALFDDMSLIENVMFPLKEHAKTLSLRQKLKKASSLLIHLGIDREHFRKLPGQLSGGQRKRGGLARALALDPSVLLYDEPTTGLDPILTDVVHELILNTHKASKHSTTVIVSHDMDAILHLADHCIMLHSGKVLLQGTPETFLNSKLPLVQRFLTKAKKSL